jgi:hypothetical protein
MPRRQEKPSPSSIAVAAFARNANWTMESLGLTEPELVTVVKKKSPRPVSQKTINNVLKARLDDAKLSTFDSIATALGVPLWVLFIPTLRASDLQSPNRERLVALMENYLRCDNDSRHHTENMAAAFAAKSGAAL